MRTLHAALAVTLAVAVVTTLWAEQPLPSVTEGIYTTEQMIGLPLKIGRLTGGPSKVSWNGSTTTRAGLVER